MGPYFCIRSGKLLKIDQTRNLIPSLKNYPIHYFTTFKAAKNFLFNTSFASTFEMNLIKSHQLDLVVYTDGGQRNDNDGAWAFSINNARKQIIYKSQYLVTKNNNYCEMEAAMQALAWLMRHGKDKMTIQLDTDSIAVQSLAKEIQNGVSIQHLSKHNNWKINQLRNFKKILHNFWHLRIKKVPGHAGVIGNQLVDELCSHALCEFYRQDYDPFRVNPSDYKRAADQKKFRSNLDHQ